MKAQLVQPYLEVPKIRILIRHDIPARREALRNTLPFPILASIALRWEVVHPKSHIWATLSLQIQAVLESR
jgi:hypothetical protein